MTPNDLTAILRIDTSPFVDGVRRVTESLERLGEYLQANRACLVLPPGVSLEFIEPLANGIRVQHDRATEVLGGRVVGPRWLVTSSSPERIRTCRGSRR